jgi:radical SAM superfamily enzyme YgiQ (UPF0313 family)
MKNKSIIKAIHTARRFGLHASVFLMIGLPGETREDVMATIKLMGQSQPGRFRWTFFFPYPGTEAFEITAKTMNIDARKMAELKNFTERSCLDFGEEHNLFLQKIGRIMPWFVNAFSNLPVSGFYKEKIQEILALDAASWEKRADGLYEEDKDISDGFVKKGLRHYAIKYNPFMGVISDYFTKE